MSQVVFTTATTKAQALAGINANFTEVYSGLTSTNSDVAAINTTLGTFGDIVTHDTDEFATAAQGAKADSAVPATRTVNSHALSADVTVTFSDLGSKPTTLSGYGITNGQPLSTSLTNLAANSGTVNLSGVALTLPSSFVTLTGTQTLTGKTIVLTGEFGGSFSFGDQSGDKGWLIVDNTLSTLSISAIVDGTGNHYFHLYDGGVEATAITATGGFFGDGAFITVSGVLLPALFPTIAGIIATPYAGSLVAQGAGTDYFGYFGGGWKPLSEDDKIASNNEANYFNNSGFLGDGSALTALTADNITAGGTFAAINADALIVGAHVLGNFLTYSSGVGGYLVAGAANVYDTTNGYVFLYSGASGGGPDGFGPQGADIAVKSYDGLTYFNNSGFHGDCSALTGIPTDVETTFAPLDSPAFTGTPTAPTQGPSDNSTKLASTAYVDAAIAALLSDSGTIGFLLAAAGITPITGTQTPVTSITYNNGIITAAS